MGSAKGVEEVRVQLKQQVGFRSSTTPETAPAIDFAMHGDEAISRVLLEQSGLCCILQADLLPCSSQHLTNLLYSWYSQLSLCVCRKQPMHKSWLDGMLKSEHGMMN